VLGIGLVVDSIAILLLVDVRYGAWGIGHRIESMGRPDFEKLEVYQLAEKLANEIWHIVKEWDYFAKDTIGKQIVRRAIVFVPTLPRGGGVTMTKTIGDD
jgi:hypothetical protein